MRIVGVTSGGGRHEVQGFAGGNSSPCRASSATVADASERSDALCFRAMVALSPSTISTVKVQG